MIFETGIEVHTGNPVELTLFFDISIPPETMKVGNGAMKSLNSENF